MVIGGVVFAQGCSFSNAPFLPTYNVEVDVNDPQASGGTHFTGTFTRGTNEAVTTVGSCSVQIQLGQCKNDEQVWVLLKALPNNVSGRGPDCDPPVWERVKKAEGKSIALAADPELTRGSGMVAEVLIGLMEDTDGNQVVDKHTEENRFATEALTKGRLDIHRATDAEAKMVDGFDNPGELLADIDISGPGIGFVKGRIDASVDAPDGMPVGPRCSWEVLAEEN